MNTHRTIALVIGLLACFSSLVSAREILEVSARSVEPMPALEITIRGNTADGHTMRLERRLVGENEQDTSTSRDSWTVIASTIVPTGTVGTFTDTNIVTGVAYEYRAFKPAVLSTEGYGVGGVQVPAPDQRGGVLLVIEEGLTNALSAELRQLTLDLVGDGWTVNQFAAPRHEAQPADAAARLAQINLVRDAISNVYFQTSASLKAVYLIGRVPIPQTLAVQDPSFASNLPPWPPDGHGDHAGCWPSDLYYADFYQDFTNNNYVWRDTTRAWTNNTMPRLSTVPGDGKFDNINTPTLLDVEVGRIDFSQMPASTLSETELIRRYLQKAHRYRTGHMPFQRRAAVTDDRASVRRSFPSWFGTNAYTITSMSNAFADVDGFYAVAANGAGSFQSVGTHYTSWDLIAHDPRFFLHIADGSYFGDWDSENNLLRAALAGERGGLLSVYAFDFDNPLRPHVNVDWSFNHMALGETAGYGLVHTMNRVFEASWLYTARPSASFNLLGDPTLRLFPVSPPTGIRAANADDDVHLFWNASAAVGVAGYHVLASTNGLSGPWARIHAGLVDGTNIVHEDAFALNPSLTYQVRAVRHEITGAGSYDNTSVGRFAPASADAIPLVTVQADVTTIAENSETPAAIHFTRTGDTTSSLVLHFALTGTAGMDDFDLSVTNSITIAADSIEATLLLTPRPDALLEGDETVTVSILPDAAYAATIYPDATLTITDANALPEAPTGLTAVEDGDDAFLSWTDVATTETRYVVERRIITGGATAIIDNEDAARVSIVPSADQWETRTFANAYNGTCLGIKKIDGTFHVDYAIGQAMTGAVDLFWWHPSGATDGVMTDQQYLYITHETGTSTNLINMQENGGTWKELGTYTLGTGSLLRVEGVTTSYRWTIADAVKAERVYHVVAELPADATSWTDTDVTPGHAYEYRVRAGLDNAVSPPSASAQLVMTGGGVNAPPVVDAGTGGTITADQHFPLSGSAHDPDDGPLPLQTLWFKISGPGGVHFADANALNTQASFTTNGTYEIGLSASDGLAAVTGSVTIVVHPARLPGAGATNGVPFELDADTIGLWRFDADGSDAGTNGLHLTLSGATIVTGGTATAWMATPSGGALRVDNFPQIASAMIPDALVLDTANRVPISLEVRFLMEAWGSNTVGYTMIGLEQNYDTHINLEQGAWGSEVGFISGNRDRLVASSEELEPYWSTGVWHHLLFTFDGTNQTAAYLDGVQVGSTLVEEPNWGRDNDHALIFGNFVGYIDEARLSRGIRPLDAPTATGPEPEPPEPPQLDAIIEMGTDGVFRFGFIAEPGQTYRIEHRDSLTTGAWTPATNIVNGTGQPAFYEDPLPGTNRFYRVQTWR
jgi:hypothetical protein